MRRLIFRSFETLRYLRERKKKKLKVGGAFGKFFGFKAVDLNMLPDLTYNGKWNVHPNTVHGEYSAYNACFCFLVMIGSIVNQVYLEITKDEINEDCHPFLFYQA